MDQRCDSPPGVETVPVVESWRAVIVERGSSSTAFFLSPQAGRRVFAPNSFFGLLLDEPLNNSHHQFLIG
jgi:hypothetical protein